MSTCKIFWVMTFWAAIVSCCLFCTGKSQGLTNCGVRSVFQRTRIVGGRRSYQGQWPWQVAIFHTNGRTGRKQFHCGGALIHSRWVLTAAHCFDYDADPRSYTIIAGDHDISVKDSKEQERQIRKIITHPGYRDDTLENDIALIGVSQNIKLTTDFVSTVCLPEAGDNLSTPGAVVHVAGWGRIREGGPSSAILLHSAYQIQNNNICRRAKGVDKFNQTVMFCAGDGKGGNDTCQGDSGGSLIRKVPRNGRYRWVTVGLVSWGKGCARPGKYGYNTRVEPFVNWIRKAMLCDLSLGMEDAVIPDGNIRSSSAIDQYHTAKEGRLNGPRAWCSRSERNPYLEIDLGKSYIITGLATQGSAFDNKWVANYTMRGNLLGSTFYSYRELRIEKVFVGNADEVSVVKHRLKNPFIGKKLRIYPVKKEGYSTSSACMRVEIYGCDLPSGCVIPGTRVVAKWPTIHKDGYIYLRGYLTEISFASWRVDLENENHAKNRFIYYSKIFDLAFVLDVPPRQRELRRNSRVLAPRGYTYITGTVEVRQRDFKYRVLADDGKRGSFTKDQLRLLKMPSVCN